MKFLRRIFARRLFRPASLKAYLIGVILGGLGPLLIFSIVMMVLFTRQEQANRRRGLQDTARALSLAVDQEINASVTHLESLATSEPLDAGAVDDFHRVATRIFRIQQSWKSIMLFDPSGRKVFSVREPLVRQPGNMSRDSLRQLLRSQRPVIGNFPGGDAAERQIYVYVPVVREGQVIYILAATIEPQVFSDILTRQKIPADWLATLFDSRQTVIARSRDASQHVGQSIEPLLGKVNLGAGEQFLSAATRHDAPVYAAINRSPLSGWYLALIVPSSEIHAILRRSLGTIIGGGVLLLLIGIGVAMVFARQVARSIGGLSSAAHALGSGQPLPSIHTPIHELNDLAREMERAAVLLRESEERLRNQAQELEEQLVASGRLVAVGELTASMAHEFNNPLGIILGFAQGLLANLEPSDTQYRHVQIIAEEAKRCEKLVQELLEFGRPKKGEFALVDIAAVIEKTVELVRSRAAANRVETLIDMAEDLPPIQADAQQLQQVLLNLCLNAIDAMPKGGKLTVRGATDGDQIHLTVADTGHGIDADTLRRIFQPFFTAKKKRGLGLGLSICDRIIKSHGGTLAASSTCGVGTVFTVRLPAIKEEAPAEQSALDKRRYRVS
jgi:signal transduction histidine kinase